MWSRVFGLMMGGVVLCAFGYRVYTVSAGPSARPLEVELSDVEEGKTPDIKHIRTGPHYRCFSNAIYYPKNLSEGREPNEYTEIGCVYYPIYSVGSPFGHQVDVLTKKYGSFENWPEDLPDNELLPTANPCMIIKTDKYTTVGKLPQGIIHANKIEGLVVNELAPLDSEQKMVLRANCGHIDFSKVLILEQNRKPSPVAVSIVFMGIGILLAVLSPIVGFKVHRSKRRPKKNVHVRAPEAAGTPVPSNPTDADNNPYRHSG